MLREDNLRLVCSDPARYEWMRLAMKWRDEPAHAPVAGSYNWGGGVMALGATIKRVHDDLLTGASAEHAAAIQNILDETRPIYSGAMPKE
jgi:hypothetical protein